MTDLSEEERLLATEMLSYHLSPETISQLLLKRRAEPTQSAKALVWINFKKMMDDVLKFREIERRRHLETDPKRTARRSGSVGW